MRITTVLGRVTTPLADALTKVLPERFPAQIQVIRTPTGANPARLIEEGEAELSMVPADVAFMAYTKGTPDLPRPYRKLRGVALLYPTVLHLLATESSRIRGLSDLRGKRVAVGADGSATELMALRALESTGMAVRDVQLNHSTDELLVAELSKGGLDAVFALGNDPSPRIQQMLKISGVHFISIPRLEAEKIRARHPFVRSTVIPDSAYGKHAEIETIGVDTLMVCREDLPEELVYWITRTLFESLPGLVRSLNAMRQIDLDQVQSSPIPLHAGAARFYRERELFQ